MKSFGYVATLATGLLAISMYTSVAASDETKDRNEKNPDHQAGKHLFERETFGGNGRTCATCHMEGSGTVSPADAQRRFAKNPRDPLFIHDGSDDGKGNGASRMLKDATVLVEIPLPPNVSLAADPSARSVIVRRGVPSTLNTPSLDPVLMLDGRQPTLGAQAMGAVHDHAQALRGLTARELDKLVDFEKSDAFFSSKTLRDYARHGVVPVLPDGKTDAERRGRRFFEDVVDFQDFKHGACAACHAGPMLNETNLFSQLAFNVPVGTRFGSVGVSEVNAAQNPVQEFIFTNPDGTKTSVFSPDPGRALITGVTPQQDPTFLNVNAFKTPSLWGLGKTAPYFHDNSAKTLEDVVAHYNLFFSIASDPDGPGPMPPLLTLSPQDQADIVAYMKLLR
ncbi:MAG: cytochrome c peroxidase [Vicinamibacterales bacterium]